jgi:hypothetical protein
VPIKIDKPQEWTDSEISVFENNPNNKSRGKVQLVQFPSDVNPDRPARFWIAKPNRQQLAVIADHEGNTAKANDLIINTGVLAGDLDQLQDDDALFFGLVREVQSLVEAKKKI